MKTIGIFPNLDKDTDYLGTAKVLGALRGKTQVLMDERIAPRITSALGEELCRHISFVSEARLFESSEIMMTLGGDGTIIKAARRCAENGIPILGVNLGRLGYLAELELDELDLLERVISGDYTTEKRMMLEAVVGGERLFALNEAVIGGASIFRIVETELYCGNNKVNRYRADGIIASTPTGSTAYSMSAGGAVIDPRMEALLITPICSHSLTATPLVFAADSELSVKNVTLREEHLLVSFDGVETRRVGYGECVTLRRAPESVSLIRLRDGGFYEVLRRKMADE